MVAKGIRELRFQFANNVYIFSMLGEICRRELEIISASFKVIANTICVDAAQYKCTFIIDIPIEPSKEFITICINFILIIRSCIITIPGLEFIFYCGSVCQTYSSTWVSGTVKCRFLPASSFSI